MNRRYWISSMNAFILKMLVQWTSNMRPFAHIPRLKTLILVTGQKLRYKRLNRTKTVERSAFWNALYSKDVETVDATAFCSSKSRLNRRWLLASKVKHCVHASQTYTHLGGGKSLLIVYFPSVDRNGLTYRYKNVEKKIWNCQNVWTLNKE